MPLDFPNSPSNGDTYEGFVYDGTTGAWKVRGGLIVPPLNYAEFSGGTSTTYTDSFGQDWSASVFTTSGTLTITSTGIADVLCIGGGGSSSSYYGNHSAGGGGAVRFGYQEFRNTGTYTVTIGGDTSIVRDADSSVFIASGRGAHGSGSNQTGSYSLAATGGGGSPGGISRNAGTQPGGGQGGTLYGANYIAGLPLDYEDGTNKEYSQGGYQYTDSATNNAKPAGCGGGNSQALDQNYSGRPGLVVVRYPV